MTPPLCKSCSEKDVFWRVKGTQYEQYLGCVYELAQYPNAHKCAQFSPKESADEEAA